MAMTSGDYRDQLRALQPPGHALPYSPDSTWGRLLQSVADAFAALDARSGELVKESDPRTTYELLPDWERAYGLPTPCLAGVSQTIQQRIDALVQQISTLGGQTPQFFVDAAARASYTITITEFDPYTVAGTVDAQIVGQNWQHAWQVNAPSVTVTQFDVTSGVSEALQTWGNERLECLINRLKPAHTYAIFSYA